MAKLIITEGGRDKIYEIVDPEFTVGNGDDADIILRDGGASSVHLSVKKTRAGFRIVDMETRTGTKVNGAMINQHLLANGDTIEIGEARLTYIGKGAPKAASAASPRRQSAEPAIRRRGAGDKAARRTAKQQSWIDQLGPAGGAFLVLGIVGAIVLILMVTSKSGAPSEDRKAFVSALGIAQDKIKNGTRNDFKEIEENLKEAKRLAESTFDKDRVRRLESEFAAFRSKVAGSNKREAAAKLFKKLKRISEVQVNNVDEIRRLGNEYLAKYPGGIEEAEVRDIIASLSNEISPERAELGKIEAQIDALFVVKKLRQAHDILKTVNPRVRDLFSDEIDDLDKKLRYRSRQYLTPRKNEARQMIREGKMDLALKLVRETIVQPLVWSTIDDYLKSPDGWNGGYRPETARVELEVQKLMKQELAAARARGDK